MAVSNALWPMIIPTPYRMFTTLELGGNEGSRLVLPVVPVHGTKAPAFGAPEPIEQRKDVRSEGFPWPGEWTVTRDEGRQKTTVHWNGKESAEYPWGKQQDFEGLTYECDDAHPDVSSVKGEAKSIFELRGLTLVWQGHLSLTTDRKNFYYKYTREVMQDGKMVKQKTWEETIPRDHQ